MGKTERRGQSGDGFKQHGLYPLVSDQAAGVEQTGLNVLPFEPGVSFQQGFGGVAGGKHPQDVLHRKAAPADDGLAAENRGVDVMRSRRLF